MNAQQHEQTPPCLLGRPLQHIKQLLGAFLLHTQPLPLLCRYCWGSSQAKHTEIFASPNYFQPACSSTPEVPVEKASQMGRVAINHQARWKWFDSGKEL